MFTLTTHLQPLSSGLIEVQNYGFSDFLMSFISPNFIQAMYNLLGILGFLMSAILFITHLLSRRKKIRIKVHDYTKIRHVVQLFINLQNYSSSSLCIHSISLINDSSEFPCELLPKAIRESGHQLITTPMFPLNLSPHQGFQCFLEFLFCEDIQLVADKTLVLKIYTNRGVINKSVTLGNISHYLHMH